MPLILTVLTAINGSLSDWVQLPRHRVLDLNGSNSNNLMILWKNQRTVKTKDRYSNLLNGD